MYRSTLLKHFLENPDGAYSYNTFALVPYLIKAIQELKPKSRKVGNNMNEQDKQISSLTIKSLSERVSNEATQSATLEALYTVTAMELEQMNESLSQTKN